MFEDDDRLLHDDDDNDGRRISMTFTGVDSSGNAVNLKGDIEEVTSNSEYMAAPEEEQFEQIQSVKKVKSAPPPQGSGQTSSVRATYENYVETEDELQRRSSEKKA